MRGEGHRPAGFVQLSCSDSRATFRGLLILVPAKSGETMAAEPPPEPSTVEPPPPPDTAETDAHAAPDETWEAWRLKRYEWEQSGKEGGTAAARAKRRK